MRTLTIALMATAAMAMGQDLPKSTDGKLQIYQKEAKFYNYSPAYQLRDSNSGIIGIHSPDYNISALKPVERFGNPNKEFPWAHPAMTSGETKTLKFIHKGVGIDIKWGRRESMIGSSGIRYQSAENFYTWTFAPGTTFGEVLMFDDGTVWEVRTRTKGENGKWHPQVYRPFRTAIELGIQIDNESIEFGSIEAESISGSTEKFSGYEYKLPKIQGAKQLLKSTVFKPVLGIPWLEVGNKTIHGYKGGGLTPDNYRGGLLEVNSKNCMRCHSDVGKHANDLNQNRDWYGHVRGSDGIFSWHPFTEGSISPSGLWIKPELR